MNTSQDLLRRYPPTLTPDERGYLSVRFADFPGIITGGETYDEAVAHAGEALALMIEEYQERGLPLPEPLAEVSGHFNVRVPRSVHRELKRRAAEEGLSLNALVAHLLGRAVGSDQL